MRTEAGEGRQHHDGRKADQEEPALVAKAARQCLALSPEPTRHSRSPPPLAA